MNSVILADNQAVFRAGAQRILSVGFRIIAQCPTLERLQNALAAFRGVTVLFASTMKHDPSQLMQQICSVDSRGITILENGEVTEPYIAAQVHGLLYRSITAPALLECVRRVDCGERVIHTAAVSDADLAALRVRNQLTPKEKKITGLVATGCKNKEIAMRLGTTEQVVKNYVRRIFDKVGVSDRLELALFVNHHPVLEQACAASMSGLPN